MPSARDDSSVYIWLVPITWPLAARSFVVERRLVAARRLLESAGADGTVTDVAMCLGFHFGRFAGQYRDVFGEAPSQTLARARR